ncbi:hypothetical protein ACQ4PT_045869 [Festuca glaucescens]
MSMRDYFRTWIPSVGGYGLRTMNVAVEEPVRVASEQTDICPEEDMRNNVNPRRPPEGMPLPDESIRQSLNMVRDDFADASSPVKHVGDIDLPPIYDEAPLRVPSSAAAGSGECGERTAGPCYDTSPLKNRNLDCNTLSGGSVPELTPVCVTPRHSPRLPSCHTTTPSVSSVPPKSTPSKRHRVADENYVPEPDAVEDHVVGDVVEKVNTKKRARAGGNRTSKVVGNVVKKRKSTVNKTEEAKRAEEDVVHDEEEDGNEHLDDLYDEEEDLCDKRAPSPVTPPYEYSDEDCLRGDGVAVQNFDNKNFVPSSQYGEHEFGEGGDAVSSKGINHVLPANVEVHNSGDKGGAGGLSEEVGDVAVVGVCQNEDATFSNMNVSPVVSDASAVDVGVYAAESVLPVVYEPGIKEIRTLKIWLLAHCLIWMC